MLRGWNSGGVALSYTFNVTNWEPVVLAIEQATRKARAHWRIQRQSKEKCLGIEWRRLREREIKCESLRARRKVDQKKARRVEGGKASPTLARDLHPASQFGNPRAVQYAFDVEIGMLVTVQTSPYAAVTTAADVSCGVTGRHAAQAEVCPVHPPEA